MRVQELKISGQSIDLRENESLTILFSISDVRDVTKRNTTSSKQIFAPATSANNIFFGSIFEITSSSTFNPNKKAPCSVLNSNITVAEGYVQLTDINYDLKGNIAEYVLQVYASNFNFISNIQNYYLTDLNFSGLTHSPSKYNVENSWTGNTDYVHIILDNNHGYQSIGGLTTVNNFELVPAIRMKSLTDRIFTQAGFTYTSDFFNSTFYKNLLVIGKTSNEADVQIDVNYIRIDNAGFEFQYNFIDAQLIKWDNQNQIEVLLANYPTQGEGLAIIGWDLTAKTTLKENDEIYIKIAQLNDSGAGTGFYRGYFNLLSGATINISFLDTSLSGSNAYVGFTGTTNYSFLSNPVPAIGDWGEGVTIQFNKKTGADFYGTGTFSDVSNSWGVVAFNQNFYTTQPLGFNYYIPKQIQLVDFISWQINLFNLYFDVDKNNAQNLIVEPRDYFYTKSGTTTWDWSDKLNLNFELNIKLLAELQSRKITFTYNSDTDYLNDTYKTDNKRIYGDCIRDFDNDFLTSEQKIENGFSPTPLQNVKNSRQIIVPNIYKFDNGTYSNTDFNIRLLYYGGLQSLTTAEQLQINYYGSSTTYNHYPFAGFDVDNLTNPTYNLNYDVPLYTYFTGSANTNNTLYKQFWEKYINQISDRDSKMITAYFHLSPSDINQLKLSDTIFFQNENFLINSIEYDASSVNSTKVELIKLVNYTVQPASNNISSVGYRLRQATKDIIGDNLRVNNIYSGDTLLTTIIGNASDKYWTADTGSNSLKRSDANNNSVTTPLSWVANGKNNNSYGGGTGYHSILNGFTNIIENSPFSSVINGSSNSLVLGSNNFIGGGKNNYTNTSIYGTILNGYSNQIRNAYKGSVLNGNNNQLINNNYSTIINGKNNYITNGANYSTIVGGSNYTLSGSNTVLIPKLIIKNITGQTGSLPILVIASNGYIQQQSILAGTNIIIDRSTSAITINSTSSTGNSSSINNGTNTYTGGSSTFQSVNVTALTINTLTVSGSSRFTTLSATTFSASTIYSGSTNLYSIFQPLGGSSTYISNGLNTYTGGTSTNPSINVSALTINTLTVSGSSRFTTLSATTFSGGTIYSGSTNLYSIFQPLGSGTSTNVQSGLNTYTGGTATNPSVNVSALTINTITASGSSTFVKLTATTLSANTFYSGSTLLSTVINTAISNYPSSSNLWTGGSGTHAVVLNFGANISQGNYSLISGKKNSGFTSSHYSVIAGGSGNTIDDNYSFIGTGLRNVSSGSKFSATINGKNNTNQSKYGLIGNGKSNYTNVSYYSSVINGNNNSIKGGSYFGQILNGNNNTLNIYSNYATILNGKQNTIYTGGSNKFNCAILAGNSNYIGSSTYGLIANGRSNQINTSYYSSILNGNNNILNSSNSSTIIGSGITLSQDLTLAINRLQQFGGFQIKPTVIDSSVITNYNIGLDDYIIYVNNTTANVTLILPISPVDGQIYYIRPYSGNVFTTNLDGNGNQLLASTGPVSASILGSVQFYYVFQWSASASIWICLMSAKSIF